MERIAGAGWDVRARWGRGNGRLPAMSTASAPIFPDPGWIGNNGLTSSIPDMNGGWI
jgi:hypothetical protein